MPIEPYYDRDGITIYHADCLDVLPQIEQVNLVLTDPPYNLRAEDIALEGRAPMLRDFGEWDQDWHPEEHLREWARVLKAGGSALAFTSDRLISEYRCGPLKPRGTVVWQKDKPPPHPRPAYVQATEYLVWLQKEGAAATWNANGYTLNIERCPAPAGGERTAHPTQKPLELIRRLIQRHSNTDDLILDPFMGSGTTLRAAKDLGRRAIGIELEEKWCEEAVKRLAQEVLPL